MMVLFIEFVKPLVFGASLEEVDFCGLSLSWSCPLDLCFCFSKLGFFFSFYFPICLDVHKQSQVHYHAFPARMDCILQDHE